MTRHAVVGFLLLATLATGNHALAQNAISAIQDAQLTNKSIEVIDSRPEKDRKFHILSLNTFSCDYGIFAFGDEQAPGRIQKVQAELERGFGDKLAGHRIIIDRYDIYDNGQDSTRHWASQVAIGGVVGAVINGPDHAGGSRCPREKMTGGWVDSSELTNNNDPYVAEIEARIDDQSIKVRAVHSPVATPGRCGSLAKKACYDNQAVRDALEAVEDAANKALSAQIAARLTAL